MSIDRSGSDRRTRAGSGSKPDRETCLPAFASRDPIRLVFNATNLGVWGRAPFKKPTRRLRRFTKP